MTCYEAEEKAIAEQISTTFECSECFTGTVEPCNKCGFIETRCSCGYRYAPCNCEVT